jgi:hypothetical protein
VLARVIKPVIKLDSRRYGKPESPRFPNRTVKQHPSANADLTLTGSAGHRPAAKTAQDKMGQAVMVVRRYLSRTGRDVSRAARAGAGR